MTTSDTPTTDVTIGDQVLLSLTAAGDRAAEASLLARHRDAVSSLSAGPLSMPLEDAGQAALRWRPRGGSPALPLRAVWLALRAQGLVPTAVPQEHRELLTAYASLTPARRLALWHRSVEGDRWSRVALHLGVPELEARATVATAYDDLRRHLALSTKTHCSTAAAYLELFRWAPVTGVVAPRQAELHSHLPHCLECDRVVARLLTAESGLGEALAETVLGPHAEGYLKRRRTWTGRDIVIPSLPRPLLAGLAAGAVAVVLTVAALPGVLAPSPPGRPVPQADAPIPGALFAQRAQQTQGRAAPLRRGSASTARRGSTPVAPTAPVVTTPHSPGTEVATPPGPTTPPSPPSPPSPPPAPPSPPRPGGGEGPVSVTVTSQSVTVGVDPAPVPVDPVVVEVPLPLGAD